MDGPGNHDSDEHHDAKRNHGGDQSSTGGPHASGHDSPIATISIPTRRRRCYGDDSDECPNIDDDDSADIAIEVITEEEYERCAHQYINVAISEACLLYTSPSPRD